MSSGSPPQVVKGPSRDFERPTLGYYPRLGELLDERTGCFLGVQLCDEKSAEAAITNVERTCLSLSLSSSDSLEKKASLLDIEPSLSLAVLGGLVKLNGSASSYLNDIGSNSVSRSWTMAFKIRTGERQLLLTQMAKEDYISEERATHFVSSIIYGGNLIIGMTKGSTYEESVEGSFEFKLEELRRAVSLSTGVGAKVKARFEGMNSKVDLVVHSDINLERKPVNPVDVLDTIPEVAKLVLGVSSNGIPKGVPVSVILRPIPKNILHGTQVAASVYHIRRPLIHETLEVFAQLEDVRKRFHVLRDRTAMYESYIPKLSKRVRRSARVFSGLYSKLTEKLGQFLGDVIAKGESDVYMFPHRSSDPKSEEGKDQQSTSSGSGNDDQDDKKEKKNFDLPGSFPSTKHRSVLEQAIYLHQVFTEISHHDRTGALTLAEVAAPQRGHEEHHRRGPNVETLVFLEKAFLDFQFLVDDIRCAVGGRLISRKWPVNPLSKLADISSVLRRPSTIHLFIMTPPDRADADSAVIRFLCLLRLYKKQRPCIFYIEDFSQLAELPNGKMFSGLNEPAYYVGTVGKDGEVNWKSRSDRALSNSSPAPVKTISVAVSRPPAKTIIPFPVAVSLTAVDGTKSFSIVFKAELGATDPFHGKRATLSADGGDIDFTLGPVKATCSSGSYLACDLQTFVTVDTQKPVIVAFVQDTSRSQAYLYVNGQLESSAPFSVSTLGQQWEKREFIYGVIKGEDTETCVSASIHRAAIYNVALTSDQVSAIYDEWLCKAPSTCSCGPWNILRWIGRKTKSALCK
ncbi:hypothetical protein EDD16DRAFT_1744423 [Pisolithus croceorrhizus]|nr:hypothetical protein EDD16DRAFT_1744423 [Pisolithus croceorrhizus]